MSDIKIGVLVSDDDGANYEIRKDKPDYFKMENGLYAVRINNDANQQEIELQNAQLVDAYNEINALTIDLRKSKEFNCGLASESEKQQQEIAELKAELEQHDDKITNIEIANQEMLAVADARINKQVDENNELKAMVEELKEAAYIVNYCASASSREKAQVDRSALDKALAIANKTPAQCLASVKADTEAELIKSMIEIGLITDGDISIINDTANKIREQK